jgi:hypothetical protein
METIIFERTIISVHIVWVKKPASDIDKQRGYNFIIEETMTNIHTGKIRHSHFYTKK